MNTIISVIHFHPVWGCVQHYLWIKSKPVLFSAVVEFVLDSRATVSQLKSSSLSQHRRRVPSRGSCSEPAGRQKYYTPWKLSFSLRLISLCLCLSSPPGLYRFHEDMENMVQVLEAPLWRGKASMVLLLPFHVESLARLDKLLTIELLSKWLEKTNMTSVSISLPKANITSTLSLQVSAIDLHLKRLFGYYIMQFSELQTKNAKK